MWGEEQPRRMEEPMPRPRCEGPVGMFENSKETSVSGMQLARRRAGRDGRWRPRRQGSGSCRALQAMASLLILCQVQASVGFEQRSDLT